jgi:hypothetical protein
MTNGRHHVFTDTEVGYGVITGEDGSIVSIAFGRLDCIESLL